jgi:Uncharacterized conserved protein
MVIELWTLGKTDKKLSNSDIELYIKRLKHYTQFSITIIDNSKFSKHFEGELLKQKEAELILQKLSDKDIFITLDENGAELTSVEFSTKLNEWLCTHHQRIVFLIGGSYGIASSLNKKAIFNLSLSKLTFPHQLVRLLFVEQLYRAFTILNNENYHHV